MAANGEAVTSVFGRKGAVTAAAGDYTADQIGDTAGRVMMTAAERARLARTITVTEFGAVGDGIADDTAAFVAAAAFVSAHRRILRVPAGTYLLKQQIRFANAPLSLVGDGLGLSVLKWAANAASLGIAVTANADTQFHHIRDLSFQVDLKGGTAITLDYSGEVDWGVIVPQKVHIFDRSSPRFLIENCLFRGAQTIWSTGWDVGIDAIAALKGTVLNCSFTGWQTGTKPTANSPFGFHFHGVNDTYENGHPVEFLVKGCSIYNTTNAICFRGVEGAYVENCNLVCVWNGVFFDAPQVPLPVLNVANSHINALATCILADDCDQATIIGNSLYAFIDASQVVTGVMLTGTSPTGCGWFKIIGNDFIDSSTSGNRFNGVVVGRGSCGLIDGNGFRACVTAVWLTAGAANCKVGNMNVYAPTPAVRYQVYNQGTGNIVRT